MQNPDSFYKEQLDLNKVESKRIFKLMSLLSILRLSVFVLTTFGIYLTNNQWQVAAVIGIIGAALFLFLLSRYTDLKSKRA
ncbi:MAG: DNA mismatch repair protein MutS, partial [Bacteroidetes bacterium]